MDNFQFHDDVIAVPYEIVREKLLRNNIKLPWLEANKSLDIIIYITQTLLDRPQ